MERRSIYLDHNATTALDQRVLEAMRPYYLVPGNAESRHSFGRRARRACDEAREKVAEILGADPGEVIFTSGGTEANNLAIFGLAGAEHDAGHVISSPIEHPAIVEPVARLESSGFRVDRVPVTREGIANLLSVSAFFTDRTRFATLMLANNETGAIQPVGALVEQCAARGIPVHTDAVQAVGRMPVDFHALGVTTLAASAHKFHGPVGIGLLLVKSGTRLGSRLFGGGQQQGRRPGTVPVALAVGLAAALEAWSNERAVRDTNWRALTHRLEAGLRVHLGPDLVIRNGPGDALRLAQTLNLGFPGQDGDILLMRLDLAGVAVSLGSACASGATRPSPTLQAMRVPEAWLRASVRFSLGAETTADEIDIVVKRVVETIQQTAPNGDFQETSACS